ncbi:MAG: hypothetical protein RR329_02030 [Mucinivorans sp.]
MFRNPCLRQNFRKRSTVTLLQLQPPHHFCQSGYCKRCFLLSDFTFERKAWQSLDATSQQQFVRHKLSTTIS